MPSLAEIVMEGGRLRSDALRQRAQIVADQQRQNGLIWGSSLANAGQTIAQGIQQANSPQEKLANINLKEKQKSIADDEKATNIFATMSRQGAHPEDIANALDQAGLTGHGSAVRTQLQTNMAAQSKAITDHLAQTEGALKLGEHVLAGIHDEPTFQAATKALPGMLGPELSNYVMQQLGPTYDPAKVDAVRAMAQDPQTRIASDKAAMEKITVGLGQAKTKAEIDKVLTEGASSLLSNAKDQNDWNDKLKLIGQGSPSVAAKFPAQFSPENAKAALQIGMTPNEISQRSRAANVEAKPMRVNGKDVPLNFHPDTGKYTDPTTGAEVTGAVPIPSAASVNVQLAGQQPTTPIDASRPDPAAGNKVDHVIGLTPNALYQNALTFALRGALPAGSRSAAAIPAQKAIQNKAAAIATAAGVDLPELKQEYDAASASTRALTQRYQLVSSSAQSAKDNIAYALELSPTIARTDIPAVNRFTQWLQHETGGGGQLPNLSQFELALYTAAREYAKVTTGSAASISELSQSAAQKVDQLINAAQTPEQFKAVTDGMQRDMGNITGPLFKTLQNINDVGPNLKRFLEFVGGGAPKASGKDPLGIR
jgi:hypothetical protein